MKIEGNSASLPTFRQWRRDHWEERFDTDYPIEMIWVSPKFKTITFQTAEFRLPEKFGSPPLMAKAQTELTKLSKTPVIAYVRVIEKLQYVVEVEKAGDACENPMTMEWVDAIGAWTINSSRS